VLSVVLRADGEDRDGCGDGPEGYGDQTGQDRAECRSRHICFHRRLNAHDCIVGAQDIETRWCIRQRPCTGSTVRRSEFALLQTVGVCNNVFVTRSDHTKQLAVNGKPLYTFMSDTKAKQTTGEGVAGFFAVRPNGTKY